ncbi:MAG: hypothetical protein KJ674_01640 [Nanoarchaeota archaeon]|nr:hypothetical protein [Nanoarchaeota archaeon]
MTFKMFPLYLLDKNKKDDVIIYIRDLPIAPENKEWLLGYWCKKVGEVLDKDMVEKVTETK